MIPEWKAGFAVGVRLLLGSYHPEITATTTVADAANTANVSLQDIKLSVAVNV